MKHIRWAAPAVLATALVAGCGSYVAPIHHQGPAQNHPSSSPAHPPGQGNSGLATPWTAPSQPPQSGSNDPFDSAQAQAQSVSQQACASIQKAWLALDSGQGSMSALLTAVQQATASVPSSDQLQEDLTKLLEHMDWYANANNSDARYEEAQAVQQYRQQVGGDCGEVGYSSVQGGLGGLFPSG